MKSQNARIRKHLESGKSLTPIQALDKFGCFRLSGRIHNLKSEGMDIKSELVTKGAKRFAKYSLA